MNGKIYAIGGRLSFSFLALGSSTDVVEEYDPAADMWGVPKERMPTARAAMVWGAYGGRIYVTGGEVQVGQKTADSRDVEVYDPVANQWSVLHTLSSNRHPVAGAVVGDALCT